jgi:phosphatidate cytidylyltransferase
MSEARGMPLPAQPAQPAQIDAPTSSSSSRMSQLGKRVLSTIVLVPIFLWIVVGGPAWLFALMIVAVSMLANWEFTRMFQRAGVPVLREAGLLWGGLVTLAFVRPDRAGAAFAVVVLGLLAASLDKGGAGPERWQRVAVTLLGVCYVNWLLGHAITLRALPDGVHWILLLVWVTWVGETAAYVVGSLAGRHKLVPGISPGKTVEGAVAQLVASLLAALAAVGWIVPGLQLRDAIAVGILLGVLGQVGDLVESAIKRSVGTKDAGSVIPGHGGILDRIDGLLFNVPVLLYYVTYGRAWSA